MATTLQVVLQTNVDKVGESGELVKVRPGFARNFLIPRGLAVPATTAAVNRIAHEKSVAIAKADKTKKEFQAVAEKINALKPLGSYEIPVRLMADVVATLKVEVAKK